jgi:hypothetical protein
LQLFLVLITVALGYFVGIRVAAIFPIVIVPAVISLARVFGSKKMENTNF